MKSKNEFKGINVTSRACYYFDNKINGSKINFNNILLNEKLYEIISVYNISYKTRASPEPLRIWLDKIDRFILALDGKMKHLILFDYRLFNKICDKIRYQNQNIKLKNGIDSYNSLPIKIILTFHNVIIIIKPAVNKNKNEYYYNTFLEKCLYKDE